MASRWYTKAIDLALRAGLDLSSAVLRVMLVKANYSHDPDSNFVSDVSASEISGTGYTRKTLASVTLTKDDTNNRVVLDAADVVWTGLTPGEDIGGAIIYAQTGGDDSTPTNDALVAFLDPSDLDPNGADTTLKFHATNGIATISV